MQKKAAKTDIGAEIIKGERRFKGLRHISSSLKAKLVDISNIEQIAEQLAKEEQIDFYSRCTEYLGLYSTRKKLQLGVYADRSKAFSHLSQRGYTTEQIQFAIESQLAAE